MINLGMASTNPFPVFVFEQINFFFRTTTVIWQSRDEKKLAGLRKWSSHISITLSHFLFFGEIT